jgi:TolB protein
MIGSAVTAGALAAMSSRSARAVLRLDITQGNLQPVPIALPDFVGAAPPDSELARNMTQVITANLKRSGLFAPIDPQAFIEKNVNVDGPRFPDWRVINAQGWLPAA